MEECRKAARAAGVSFVKKSSPTLLNQLRQFTAANFGFGDFIFRGSDGSEVGRASNLHALEEQLQEVPDESILFHAERNHFSNWLKARTEFWLAHQLRPRKVSDFASVKALRDDLISSLRGYRAIVNAVSSLTSISMTFDPKRGFARIGGGSVGGKARGLSFVSNLIYNYRVHNRFPDVNIYVPLWFRSRYRYF
jgi:hypothetical protein